MKKVLLLAIISSISCSVFAQIPTDKRLKGLDTFALRILKEWNAPGVTIAVVEKGKIIYTGGFGFRDYEKKLPVTENTQFAIGSCTKAFTASILGMLEKDGKVDLDKPVRNYLTELKFKNGYTNEKITLRDMMCHRSGLPRHDFSWYGSTASRSELLARIEFLEPSAELREKFQYNNFMFLAQGMVIEKITGKSWEENIREKILVPLGMNNTNMSVIDMAKSADHALAYAIENDKPKLIPYRNIDAIGPAGSINSCAKDMASWLITWINSGKYNNKEIIPEGYRSQAITSQIAPGGGLPGSENPDLHMSGYGLAWGMSSYRGHYRVEHGGGIDGFITSTSFFPSDSIGIFVVTNQSTPTTSIRNFIVDRMLNQPYRPWGNSAMAEKIKADSVISISPNKDSLNKKPGTKHSFSLKEYAGDYSNKGYGTMKFFIERDTLWIDYNEAGLRSKSYLEHYHFDIFRARSTDEKENPKDASKLKFNMNMKGEVESVEMKLEPAVNDIVFEKELKKIEISKSDLKKYVGEYEFRPGAEAKFYLKGESILYVFIEGQPEYELVPIEENKFALKILPDYKVEFEANDKKEIIAVTFIQPNGSFKATKKK